MQTKNDRKYIILSTSLTVILVIIAIILLWNNALGNQAPGILPFVLAGVAILSIGYNLNLSLKATNQHLINETIENRVAEERTKLLREFEKKDETEVQTDDSEVIENSLKEIIPKGNFKSSDPLLTKYFKNLSDSIEVVQGILYIKDEKSEEYKFSSGFALTNEENIPSFKPGEALPGQVAQFTQPVYISDIPEEYFLAESGLGKAKPKHLVFVPITLNDIVVAIMELATFKEIIGINKQILEQSVTEISSKLSQTLKA